MCAPGLARSCGRLADAAPRTCTCAQMTAIDRSVRHRLWFSSQIDHAEGARSPRLVSAGGGIERRIARPFDSSTGHPADVVRSGETTSSRVRRNRRPVRIVDRRSPHCPYPRHGREGPVQGKRQCTRGSSCRSVILRSSDVERLNFTGARCRAQQAQRRRLPTRAEMQQRLARQSPRRAPLSRSNRWQASDANATCTLSPSRTFGRASVRSLTM